jgi:hypothetical protein
MEEVLPLTERRRFAEKAGIMFVEDLRVDVGDERWRTAGNWVVEVERRMKED